MTVKGTADEEEKEERMYRDVQLREEELELKQQEQQQNSTGTNQ
jgi:hypothetical protein